MLSMTVCICMTLHVPEALQMFDVYSQGRCNFCEIVSCFYDILKDAQATHLPWRGRRMKRNLKLVINCDALMIMILKPE